MRALESASNVAASNCMAGASPKSRLVKDPVESFLGASGWQSIAVVIGAGGELAMRIECLSCELCCAAASADWAGLAGQGVRAGRCKMARQRRLRGAARGAHAC